MKKLYEKFCKVETVFCGIGFVFLVLFVFASAIFRFLRISMSWNIDFSMLLLAWTAFLGADIAWREGQLIGIDIVTRYFPKKVQKIILMLVYAIIFFTTIYISYYGIKLMWTERLRTYQSMPIPYSIVTLSLVITTISMSFSTIVKIKDVIVGFNKDN